ncbi:hypothetical protein PCIT_b0024 [Pseudoalteromonas citrea]|uniref:Outer membrane protein beta-barrel domain-containing protein n=2 Tax=Pseudoalteromonas citrea TaxID=43655 RepID=A0AAD4FPK5_9GAMM|nr:hypothetical protein [Pseudoalteromonas citrea]KAF7764117.1 hypothetical protein PCIT_b0024 [Pseudoalteromonas citrea]
MRCTIKVLLNLALIGMLITYTKVHANDLDFYKYHIGVKTSYLNVNNQTNKPEQNLLLEDYGASLGAFYSGQYNSYMSFAVGIDFIYIEDKLPFSESVRNEFTGELSSKESSIFGKAIYAEGGIFYPFLYQNQLQIGLLGGYRYNDLTRTIFRCEQCQEQELYQFENSTYVKPFIKYKFSARFSLQIAYSHYFNEMGFDNSIDLQVTLVKF